MSVNPEGAQRDEQKSCTRIWSASSCGEGRASCGSSGNPSQQQMRSRLVSLFVVSSSP